MTLEDLKSAEQLVQKKNPVVDEQRSASDSEKNAESVPNHRLEDSKDARTAPNIERRSSWRVQLSPDKVIVSWLVLFLAIERCVLMLRLLLQSTEWMLEVVVRFLFIVCRINIMNMTPFPVKC